MDLSLIFVPLNKLGDTRKLIRNGCFRGQLGWEKSGMLAIDCYYDGISDGDTKKKKKMERMITAAVSLIQ